MTHENDDDIHKETSAIKKELETIAGAHSALAFYNAIRREYFFMRQSLLSTGEISNAETAIIEAEEIREFNWIIKNKQS